MALKGGFKNFANQTREIKEAPPLDLGSDVPALHVVQEPPAVQGEPKPLLTAQSAAPAPTAAPGQVAGAVQGGETGGAELTAASETEEGGGGTAGASVPVVSRHTHYTELVRKELRLHADQADELTVLASKVQRARKEKGERITDNTLIRVAVDLLLERQKELVGSTEDELRVALGLAPRA